MHFGVRCGANDGKIHSVDTETFRCNSEGGYIKVYRPAHAGMLLHQVCVCVCVLCDTHRRTFNTYMAHPFP